METFHDAKKRIRESLPASVFEPDTSRFIFGAALAAFAFSIVPIVKYGNLHWSIDILLGVLLGSIFGVSLFLAHEALHGAITKSRRLQWFLGFAFLTPFFISPTFWRHWHNRLHHGHTQILSKDPDAFPTLNVYKQSTYMRQLYKLTPGSGYKRSYFYLFYWFSAQALINQLYFRFHQKIWKRVPQRRVNMEIAAQLSIAVGYIVYVGLDHFIPLVLVPFFAQNYLAMSYISTNHSLCPLTKDRDPIKATLSVRNNRILEFLHLNMGFHTEHHLFPAVSGKHARIIRKAILDNAPDSYRSMDKYAAIRMLYSTPRIYKGMTRFVNPVTGDTYPTIGYKN